MPQQVFVFVYNAQKLTQNGYVFVFTIIQVQDVPIHLLGIGDPIDIWNLVNFGIDTFDCVSPTRMARHGAALTRYGTGKLNIRNAAYRKDINKLDNFCECYTCNYYSRSFTI